MYHFSIALDDRNADCHGIRNWEVNDGYFGEKLSRMNGEQVEDIRDLLIRKLARIVLYSVDMPVEDYDAYVRFFRHAHLIGVENVKLANTAFIDAPEAALRRVLAIGEAFSIKALFELEADHMDAFGLSQYAAIRSENTGLVFNPDAFLRKGILPYTQLLSKMKLMNDIALLRVNDRNTETGEAVLPRHGGSEIKECVSKLLARSYPGYFAFHPYAPGLPMEDIISAFTELLCQM